MAKKLKVVTPDQTMLLSEAMSCENPNTTELLIQRAMECVYSNRASWKNDEWDLEDWDAIVTMIKNINPRDMVEAVLAAQFVALHLQGTKNVAGENYNIMGHSLQMIRLSHQALNMLQQYRSKSQTINVNYNMLNQADNIFNTVNAKGLSEKNEQTS